MRFAHVLSLPGVRETVALRGSLGLLAPHGTSIEDGTERIAADVADRTGSSLYCVTYPGTWDEARPLHVSCTLIEPSESEALAGFFAHCRTVVAVHGYTRAHLRHSALVGGANTPFAAAVARELRAHLPEPADVLEGDDVPAELRGTSPANLVNRFAEPGVQVELPPRLRAAYPSRIFWGGSAPSPNPYAEAVVDALSAAITCFNGAGMTATGRP